MKLYYYPGACSMAAHIVLREAGYDFELERVDLASKTTASGEDYLRVNAKGYVPALRLDNGEVLTEDVVILQYLADLKPSTRLSPLAGGLECYRQMEWLNFIATELHKTLGALFNPGMTPEWKSHLLALFEKRATWLSQRLGTQPYLMGENFSIADAYLFTVLGWCSLFGIDLGRWPNLQEYLARIASRPAVRAAMHAEGLHDA
ncbi:MAG TPA: glutathione transferase GstA [Thiobacillaceae bacterium]|nr:glutathione transferase GstA [Thiobacillaceae bacterium]HNU63392.1 glutathione transferase GstA [Thiobacillaceae bacterium]